MVGLALHTAPAVAQGLEDYDYENLTFRGVGLDLGYIWPSKVEATPTFGVRLDLGYLGPAVRIAPLISFWSSEMRNSELDRLAGQLSNLRPLRDRNVVITRADLEPIDWSSLAVGVDAHYVWVTPLDVYTYLGLGALLHAMNGQGESIDDTFVEDLLDSVMPSLSVVAGAEYTTIERVRVFGEARYTLASDIHYPGLRLGTMLMLPPREGASRPVYPGGSAAR